MRQETNAAACATRKNDHNAQANHESPSESRRPPEGGRPPADGGKASPPANGTNGRPRANRKDGKQFTRAPKNGGAMRRAEHGRHTGADVPATPAPVPGMVLLSSQNRTQTPGIPLFARRRLSRGAYALLEAFRVGQTGIQGHTTYEQLMEAAGYASRAAIARALADLKVLGVITTQVERAEGKVKGLLVQYLGPPAALPDDARVEYIERSRSELGALTRRMRELEEDIERLEAAADRKADPREAASDPA